MSGSYDSKQLNSEVFDEMQTAFGPRVPYEQFYEWFKSEDQRQLRKKPKELDNFFRKTGITFNVYGDSDGEERLIPFDFIPRIISELRWRKIETGLKQRANAINAFLSDIYGNQEIIRAGWIPEELISQNAAFLPEMIGVKPPGGIYTHISGTDLIRVNDEKFVVLEDNVRTPSGASYMIENRETMLHMFPELFTRIPVKSVSNYPEQLLKILIASAPASATATPVIGVLTPGVLNSAYFEHAFLADQMGAELIEGTDTKIIDKKLMMRTTQGYRAVDVIYRRIDDNFVDPLNFNPNSLIGIPGLFDVYRNGAITLANAPGTGIADDKAVYSFMPEIIKFYTGSTPILENVETWRCSEELSLKYVIDNIEELVIKEVHGSGGYGLLIGPTSSKKERAIFLRKLRANPSNYIAQPTLSLSTVPIMEKEGLAPRHVDLRPFVLMSPTEVKVTPGGLTRVALKKGSLVVNSSQGGGTKDTWVLEGV